MCDGCIAMVRGAACVPCMAEGASMNAFGYALLQAGQPSEIGPKNLSFSGQLNFGLMPLIRYSGVGQVNKFQYFKSIGRHLLLETYVHLRTRHRNICGRHVARRAQHVPAVRLAV